MSYHPPPHQCQNPPKPSFQQKYQFLHLQLNHLRTLSKHRSGPTYHLGTTPYALTILLSTMVLSPPWMTPILQQEVKVSTEHFVMEQPFNNYSSFCPCLLLFGFVDNIIKGQQHESDFISFCLCLFLFGYLLSLISYLLSLISLSSYLWLISY